MWLTCSARCGSALFRAVSAEVDLDASGEYQGHRITQAAFVCLNCAAPAFDLGSVPAEMEAEEAEDAVPDSVDVLCPVCETLISVLPGEDCPNCGAQLDL